MTHKVLSALIFIYTSCLVAWWDPLFEDMHTRFERDRQQMDRHFQEVTKAFNTEHISSCAISSNKSEVVVSINLMKEPTPENIAVTLQGRILTIDITLGQIHYALVAKATTDKVAILCSQKQAAKEQAHNEAGSAYTASASSTMSQQVLPLAVDLDKSFIEIDGTLLHLHLPRLTQDEPARTIPVHNKNSKPKKSAAHKKIVQPSFPETLLDADLK